MTENPDNADRDDPASPPDKRLRYGWTTGACATAATKAAYQALLTGSFPDPVEISLPQGQTPAFGLARSSLGAGFAEAGIVKDAGDDPDVTHGAMIISRVTRGEVGSGVVFKAGDGVGMITKPGLPIAPGEPAINPVPRQLMADVIKELSLQHDVAPDVVIEIHVPDGARIAEKTWNGRLGIVGGISILGTTGIVVPYSCSAWIHSIHRGIDVARATGEAHVAACVGETSERAVQSIYDLPETSYLDLGDFVGGLLKYLRKHPLPRITLAGGFAKFSKLANGALDLHSSRSQVDKVFLAALLGDLGCSEEQQQRARAANTALEILQISNQLNVPLADQVAIKAKQVAVATLKGADVDVEVVVVDRSGNVIARAGFSNPLFTSGHKE